MMVVIFLGGEICLVWKLEINLCKLYVLVWYGKGFDMIWEEYVY